MDLEKALEQISTIHDHIARARVYRGYRAVPIALTGALAVVAAGLQPWFTSPADPVQGIYYWVIVAAVAFPVAMSGVVHNYFRAESPTQREQTLSATGQLAPALLAGALVTVAFLPMGLPLIQTLPGLWAVFMSLGIFASRPWLPKGALHLAFYYLLSGLFLLAVAPEGWSLRPWAMGWVFGIGQWLTAIILFARREHREHD